MNDPLDIIVVGAGIAGLSAALTATAAGSRVAVLDAHEPGGRAKTVERDGFALNVGPHALYRGGHLAALLAEHGIVVAGRSPDVTRAQLLRDGVLTPFEFGAAGVARTSLLGVRDRARLATLMSRLPRLDPTTLVGRSVDEWLGDHPLRVRQFVDTFIRLSTYANAPGELDAGAAVAQFQLGGSGVIYLHGGWGSMVRSMSDVVRGRGCEVLPDHEVTSIASDGAGVNVVVGDRQLRARSVVVAAGGPDLVERLTGHRAQGTERLSAPVVASCLDLATTRPHTGLALGLDEPLYLSPHAPVADLAPAGRGLVSVLRYVEVGREPADQATARDELRSLARLAGIGDDHVMHERYLHRMVVSHGAPTARGGGLAGRPGVDCVSVPGVYVAGDWVGPTGFIADASAASGHQAALAALQHGASITA